MDSKDQQIQQQQQQIQQLQQQQIQQQQMQIQQLQSQQMQQQQQISAQPTTNEWAVWAMICAFLIPILGIILGAVGIGVGASRDGCGQILAATAVMVSIFSGIIWSMFLYNPLLQL